jgi:hypothetical protein
MADSQRINNNDTGPLQTKRTSPLWGIIIGCAALVVLLGTGYVLIA